MALSKEDRLKVARQKTKVRRSGPSWLGKSKDLGVKGDTFTLGLYWERTHKEHRLRMHLPDGWSIPDVNSMLAGAAAASSPEQAGSPGPQQTQGPHKFPSRTQQKPSNRVEKPQPRPVRRSARQRARLHANQALGSDPYEFTGTPEPAAQQSNQDAGSAILRSPDTGSSGPLATQHQSENESLHPSGGLEAAQETAEDAGVGIQGAEELQSDAPGEIDLDALASASADIAHMSDGTFELQNISSPFGSSSWMNIDFLGDLPNDAEFNNQDVQELQQRSDVQQPAVMGLPRTAAPRPGPNMAWWRLARESMSLLRKIMSPQKDIFEAEL